jgi:hypothetical protein
MQRGVNVSQGIVNNRTENRLKYQVLIVDGLLAFG